MSALGILIGIIVLLVVHKLILAPLRHLLGNVVIGLIVLFAVNHFGYLLNLAHVPITLATGLISGVFGLPGVVVLVLYYTFLQ